MTPKLAAALRIHEPEVAGVGPANAGVLDRATERRSRFRVIEGLYDPAPSWQHRQALHRRFLGIGDVLASALAIAIVLALPGGAQLGPVVLAGMPLTVLIFKLAGLYDRDQMRLVRSTLDEVPLILQLSGLYALGRDDPRAGPAQRPPAHDRDGRPVGAQLRVDRRRARDRALGGAEGVPRRALPRDRRDRPGAAHPREARQQPLPHARGGDAAAQRAPRRQPRRRRRRAPDGRARRRAPDHHRPDAHGSERRRRS